MIKKYKYILIIILFIIQPYKANSYSFNSDYSYSYKKNSNEDIKEIKTFISLIKFPCAIAVDIYKNKENIKNELLFKSAYLFLDSLDIFYKSVLDIDSINLEGFIGIAHFIYFIVSLVKLRQLDIKNKEKIIEEPVNEVDETIIDEQNLNKIETNKDEEVASKTEINKKNIKKKVGKFRKLLFYFLKYSALASDSACSFAFSNVPSGYNWRQVRELTSLTSFFLKLSSYFIDTKNSKITNYFLFAFSSFFGINGISGFLPACKWSSKKDFWEWEEKFKREREERSKEEGDFFDTFNSYFNRNTRSNRSYNGHGTNFNAGYRQRNIPKRSRNSAKQYRKFNYYTILNIPRNADQNAIKKAFRMLIRKGVHPDKGAPVSASKALNVAYKQLSNPETKAVYDSWLNGILNITSYDDKFTNVITDEVREYFERINKS